MPRSSLFSAALLRRLHSETQFGDLRFHRGPVRGGFGAVGFMLRRQYVHGDRFLLLILLLLHQSFSDHGRLIEWMSSLFRSWRLRSAASESGVSPYWLGPHPT